MPTDREYWDAVRGEVCVRCPDGDGEGNCRLPAQRTCRLKAYFPEVLHVVHSVYSHSIAPYEDLLHLSVCSSCPATGPNGVCPPHEVERCLLNRYFPVVIQAIEETQTRNRLGY